MQFRCFFWNKTRNDNRRLRSWFRYFFCPCCFRWFFPGRALNRQEVWARLSTLTRFRCLITEEPVALKHQISRLTFIHHGGGNTRSLKPIRHFSAEGWGLLGAIMRLERLCRPQMLTICTLFTLVEIMASYYLHHRLTILDLFLLSIFLRVICRLV